ncbi:MAG: hypothetical protein K0A90_08515 [Methanosarcinaceae archaeon]|nr:hypothetical protein [Methanosarcinaceae archaeon]
MKEPNDWLSAVEIIGNILIFTPIIVSIPPIIYAILTGVNVSIGDVGAGFSAGLMIFAGIIALIYVSIKRYKEG